MHEYKREDLASFPPLFTDIEVFIDEQLKALKRAGLLTVSFSASCLITAMYVLEKLA
ncbi:MAG: hypothetical protein L6Q40_01130 [Azonexus sp.]|nr:hypothetical protein [Azonexus sp.]